LITSGMVKLTGSLKSSPFTIIWERWTIELRPA
jgi:hypothetical protein